MPNPGTIDSFRLKIATISESLYWYDKSYSRVSGMIPGFFSEGAALYSNVHGGYGAFGAAAVVWLDVE